MNSLRLDGKTALITGCGHSWLPELAFSFAESGARVAVIDLDKGKVFNSHQKLDGKVSLVLTGDVHNSTQIKSLINEAITKLGNLDILINSFNMEKSKAALDMTIEDWDRVNHANLRAVFLVCQAVAPKLIEAGKGSIVNIVSGLGEHGAMNTSAYCASMSGVFGLIKSLALEWAVKGVRINGLAVGWREKHTEGSPQDKMEKLIDRYIPVERRCRPYDVTPMAILLASDAASYISGHIYFVDGGLHARA